MKLLKVDTIEEAKNKMDMHFQDFFLKTEKIPLHNAVGRILAEDVDSPIDLPEFDRATVDGYALLSKDTFGAGESLPVFLDVIGKVDIGKDTALHIDSGKAAYVPTGGMIPEGADGMVMIEYVEHLDEYTIAVYDSIAPGDGIIRRGDDVKKGEHILSKGKKLKPQDIGFLAAVGIAEINVFRKPKVGILSTGDELVCPGEKVEFGQIRDINTYTLSAMVEEAGGAVCYQAIVEDDFQKLTEAVQHAAKESDLILISGGSSAGIKDMTAQVIDSLGEPGVFVHGLAIKPGKPTIIGKAAGIPIFGLPGHPISAMMIFKVIVEYLLNKGFFRSNREDILIQAICDANIHASPGKETYQMVALEKNNEQQYIARPIHGKSGAISLWMKAQGYIRIGQNQEGIQKGEKVEVVLL